MGALVKGEPNLWLKPRNGESRGRLDVLYTDGKGVEEHIVITCEGIRVRAEVKKWFLATRPEEVTDKK